MTVGRRSIYSQFTPVEMAIFDARQAVEGLGADVRLTEACQLLLAAQTRVADFVDGVPGLHTFPEQKFPTCSICGAYKPEGARCDH